MVLGVGTLVACSDFPTRFMAPEVPVVLQIPLMDSLLTLADLIQDTTQVRIEPGTGNVAVALEGELSPVNLAQELGNVGELRLERAFRLNELEGIREHFQGWGQPLQEFPLKVLYPQLPEPPSSAVLPAVEGAVVVDSLIRLPQELVAVGYRAGTCELVLENDCPVTLVLGTLPGYGQPGIVLQTPGYGEWFFAVTEVQRTIPPGQRRGGAQDPGGPLRLPLAGVVLSRQTRLRLALQSPGSGGREVTYTAQSALRVYGQLQEVQVEWAQVLPTSWEAEVTVELPLPHGAELSAAELSSAQAQLEIQNDFPVAFRGEWRFTQLRFRDGSVPAQPFAVPASGKDVRMLQLQGPLVLAPEPEDGGSVRVLRVRIPLQVEPPAEPVIVRAEQGMTVAVVVEGIALRWARGRRLPVGSFTVQAQSEVWLQGNLGLLSQVELELSELIVEARLENSAAVGFRVEGTVELADRNGVTLAVLSLPPQVIEPAREQSGVFVPSLNQWRLRYGDVQLRARPRFVRFSWNVTPEAADAWAFADTSQIRGSVQLLIPVRVRVQRLQYEHTWAFTGGEELRRQGRKVERAAFVVELQNRFPVALQLSLVLSDTLESVRIPPEGELLFAAAPVTAEGVAAGGQKTLQRFELDQQQLAVLLRAERVSVVLLSWTTAEQYVRIRSSDYVHLRAMLRAELALP